MPGHRHPAAARQEPQAIIEPRCEAPDPKGVDAGCGELDRERNPIQPLADCGDNRGVCIAELELARTCGSALDEQLNRRKRQRLRRRESDCRGGARERRQAVDALPLGAQRFTAGRSARRERL